MQVPIPFLFLTLRYIDCFSNILCASDVLRNISHFLYFLVFFVCCVCFLSWVTDCFFVFEIVLYVRVFLRRFRDPIRVPIIENRVPRFRDNYHRVPRIRENRVPRIREIGSQVVHTGYLTFSLKQTLLYVHFGQIQYFFFSFPNDLINMTCLYLSHIHNEKTVSVSPASHCHGPVTFFTIQVCCCSILDRNTSAKVRSRLLVNTVRSHRYLFHH